jgi:hypothetical protein
MFGSSDGFLSTARSTLKAIRDRSFPGVKIWRRFGGQRLLATRLREYCAAKGYGDVAALCHSVASQPTHGEAGARAEAQHAREAVGAGDTAVTVGPDPGGRTSELRPHRRLAALAAITQAAVALEALVEKLRVLGEQCAAFSSEFAPLLTSTSALLGVMAGPGPELEDRRRLVAAIRKSVVRLLPFCKPISEGVQGLDFAVTQLRDGLAVFKRESPRVLPDDPEVVRFMKVSQETWEQIDGLVGWFPLIARAVEYLDRARQKLQILEAKQAVIEARVEAVTTTLAELATAYGTLASAASTPEARAHAQDFADWVTVTSTTVSKELGRTEGTMPASWHGQKT